MEVETKPNYSKLTVWIDFLTDALLNFFFFYLIACFKLICKVAELKELLKAAGLPISGKKEELIQRLTDNGCLFLLPPLSLEQFFSLIGNR